jgi:tRNA(Arg) A34 adenosine deaminase TadA
MVKKIMVIFDYMSIAIEEAHLAAQRGEVPVGAVVVNPSSKKVLARNGNRVIELNDPTAHAEIIVIREAAAFLGCAKLSGLELYVTLEPCAMCAAAISFARLRKLEFGAYDSKSGGVEHGAMVFNRTTCHHTPSIVGGIRETENKKILRDFFANLRSQ